MRPATERRVPPSFWRHQNFARVDRKMRRLLLVTLKELIAANTALSADDPPMWRLTVDAIHMLQIGVYELAWDEARHVYFLATPDKESTGPPQGHA